MPLNQAAYAPNLAAFLKSIKEVPLETSIETLIA
jgi:hypothetical protein